MFDEEPLASIISIIILKFPDPTVDVKFKSIQSPSQAGFGAIVEKSQLPPDPKTCTVPVAMHPGLFISVAST
jgi:hypothetical protein